MNDLKPASKRLLALDILRGITIAGMITVNNPGSWSFVYAPLSHATWNGLTPTDLVFPLFMFIMGISTYISLKKTNFVATKPLVFKIIKRTILIFLIGLGLKWVSLSFSTYHALAESGLSGGEKFLKAITDFEHLRIMGVMQRLGITYGITSIVAITMKHKHIPFLIGGILIAYSLLLLFGNGYELSENNILSIFDRSILGEDHMYKIGGVALDPEGLLSTLFATSHVLIGFCIGKIIMDTKDNDKRIESLFIWGTILTFGGYLLSYLLPINKNIWSPSYIIVTCGIAASALGLLIWIIDIKGYKKWSMPFEAFGINPLFMYMLAEVLSPVLSGVRFTSGGEWTSISGFAYTNILQPILGDYNASLVFALLFTTIIWLAGSILYKKQIYIKL